MDISIQPISVIIGKLEFEGGLIDCIEHFQVVSRLLMKVRRSKTKEL